MCLGLLDNLVSVLNISGSYSRSLNARPVFFPWSCDDPGQGVVSIEGLAQVQASPHVASPWLLATAQPQLLSPLLLPQLQKLLLATSYPASSSDTQKEGTAWRQAGLRSQSQRPCVKVFLHMPPSPPGPPGGFWEVQPSALIRDIKFNQLPVPSLLLTRPCSWHAGYFLKPRTVWGSRKSPGCPYTRPCSRHSVRHWVRLGTRKMWPALRGLTLMR